MSNNKIMSHSFALFPTGLSQLKFHLKISEKLKRLVTNARKFAFTLLTKWHADWPEKEIFKKCTDRLL